MRVDVEDRFWSRVAKAPGRGCWTWQGSAERYGYFYAGGRNVYAHRVAWILTNGAVPAGQFVLHRCDNPPCVRPDHLFLGTHAENMADMVRKGRSNNANRGKVLCRHGHDLSGANVRLDTKGRRRCVACRRRINNARYARMKEK